MKKKKKGSERTCEDQPGEDSSCAWTLPPFLPYLAANAVQIFGANPGNGISGSHGFGAKEFFVFKGKATGKQVAPQATYGAALTQDAHARSDVDHEGFPNQINGSHNGTTHDIPHTTGIAAKDFFARRHGWWWWWLPWRALFSSSSCRRAASSCRKKIDQMKKGWGERIDMVPRCSMICAGKQSS